MEGPLRKQVHSLKCHHPMQPHTRHRTVRRATVPPPAMNVVTPTTPFRPVASALPFATSWCVGYGQKLYHFGSVCVLRGVLAGDTLSFVYTQGHSSARGDGTTSRTNSFNQASASHRMLLRPTPHRSRPFPPLHAAEMSCTTEGRVFGWIGQ